jgi:hypothetical protein
MTNRGPLQPVNEYEEVEYEEVEEPAERSGCLWGLLGATGCLLIPLVAVAFVVLMGINTLNGVVEGITGIFSPPPRTYSVIDETLILERVQRLSELTTTRFNYSQLVVTERDMPALLRPLYGERMTMNAVGHITAGIDMSQLTTEDIDMTDGALTVRLPSPQLFDCILNAQETRVVDSSTGLFTAPSNLQEETQRIALRHIRNAALQQDILGQANEYAETAVGDLLVLLTSAITPPDAPPMVVNVITTPAEPVEEFPQTCV